MFFSDYHTHTVYSHGKGTIKENALAATKLALKELAITDHGFFHRAYALRRMDLPDYLADIKAAKASLGINILCGLECNLLNSKGDIDIKKEDYKWLDILICGHHKFVKGTGLIETFKHTLPIFMAGLSGKSSAKRVVANTDAFVKAMERHNIDIISHPNLGILTNIKELSRAAAHFGTYLELNGKGIRLNKHQVHEALSEGAQFIANSDAHSPERIGDFSKIYDFAQSAQIPLDLIANYNKLPKFKEKL